MKRYLVYIFCLATLLSCDRGYVQQGGNYSFTCDSLDYSVEFRDASIVRIVAKPMGSDFVTKRLVVDSIVSRVDVDVDSSDELLSFSTSKIKVEYNKLSQLFAFYDADSGEIILKENARSFTAETVGGEPCFSILQSFDIESNEALYGLGQYQDGVVNRRGTSLRLLQSNMDITNPYLVSTKGYGVLWDNYSSSLFEESSNAFSFWSEVADAVDYYFVYGGSVDGSVKGYRTLTGEASMLPKWVFGFWQSKERYKSFDELESVVAEYRKRKIPIDNIVQDWEYWGDKSKWNSLTWDSDKFANPKEVVGRLHSDYNVNILLSVWPGFGKETAIYNDLDKIGALFDEPTWAGYKVFDAYNPEAREIFWSHLKRGLFDVGIDGWWMDATEPSFRDGFTQLKQEARVKSAGKTYLGAFHRYLNVYSLELTKFMYAKLRAAAPEKRPFIFTRSAFASQQQYGMAVWSGDIGASWESMKRQLAAGVNISMSGIPYWTFDIGGFFVTERYGKYPRGLADDNYKELYSRWFQFGAFTPIFRAHGTNVPREIWQFGSAGDAWYDNQLKFINLRYSLMPYIYSMAYDVHNGGGTMMRSLAMEFTDDVKSHNVDDSYMFGESILVRPVFEAGAGENSTQRVSTYLPTHKGKYWYDFETRGVIDGGEIYSKEYSLSELPLFIKGGSILPMGDVKQFTRESADTNLSINVYSGADASFTLFDDSGDGYGYMSDECAIVEFDWNNETKKLTISERIGEYGGMAAVQNLKVNLFSPDGRVQEQSVVYNGEKIVIIF